jgi:hypothetical protein
MSSKRILVATLFAIILLSTNIEAQENQFILKVANFNVKGLPLPWLKHKKRYLRIVDDIKKLEAKGDGPHIISFQEAMALKTRVLHENLNYPYRARGPNRKGLKSNSGLETLSHFPISAEKTLAYDRCISWDCLSKKGLQYFKVKIPGVPTEIQIINTHMQAGPSSDPITPRWKTDEVRAHQAGEYADFFYEHRDHASPILLIGDFNFRQYNDLYDWFEAMLGVENAAYFCGVEKSCTGSSNPYEIWLKMIDHQFYSSGTGRVRIRPIHFETLFTDRLNTDHDLIMTHYLITW